MAEEVKTKTTKTKVEKEEVVSEPVAASKPVEEAVESPVQEPVVEQPVTPEPVTPEPVVAKEEKKPVKSEPVAVQESNNDDFEAMGKRGRKSKAQLLAQYEHELTIKITNEPWKSDVYREEYKEKIDSL